jgi:protein TonB
MFEDSLIESSGRLKIKRGVTTFASFLLEALLVVILVLIPLLFTEALPKTQLMTFLVAPPPPPPAVAPRVAKQIQTRIVSELRTPTEIPTPPLMSPGVVGAEGGPEGPLRGLLEGIIRSSSVVVAEMAAPHRVLVSQGVTQGMVLHRVQPSYPPLARQARIQGSVVLQAEIGKDGSIQNLHLISGHPMLAPSAIEAVKQWRYKPYILNREPVEVETTITVNFMLAGG